MLRFAVSKKKQEILLCRMNQLGIYEKDIIEQYIKGGGKGGQKINKTSSCVILKHIPSGITVKCQKERKLSINRFLARRILADKIEELKTGTVKTKVKKLKKQKQKRRKRALAKYQTPRKNKKGDS